jgi:uncharacterized protein involved in exopolysaccharide biosynthesis
MFMAFHSSPRRKPVLIAAALSLLLLGVGIALSLG